MIQLANIERFFTTYFFNCLLSIDMDFTSAEAIIKQKTNNTDAFAAIMMTNFLISDALLELVLCCFPFLYFGLLVCSCSYTEVPQGNRCLHWLQISNVAQELTYTDQSVCSNAAELPPYDTILSDFLVFICTCRWRDGKKKIPHSKEAAPLLFTMLTSVAKTCFAV